MLEFCFKVLAEEEEDADFDRDDAREEASRHDDDREEVVDRKAFVGAVHDKAKLSRTSDVRFHVARVKKPLASAVKVVEAGNCIIMGPRPGDSCIENLRTGERMAIRVGRGTYVFEVEFANGDDGTITLDLGAGVNVWPEELLPDVPTMARSQAFV
mgnify:CR=1 FL=1